MSSWQYLPSGMLFHRRMLIRASLLLNFCVLTYVALHAAQGTTTSGDATSGAAAAAASSGSFAAESFNLPSGVHIVQNHRQEAAAAAAAAAAVAAAAAATAAEAVAEVPAPVPLPVSVTSLHLSTEMDTESSATSEMNNNNNPTLPESTDPPHPAELKLPCQDRDSSFSYTQRGSFWVLNNYIQADDFYRCNESVTYTTHGDVTFLDNLIPLAKRWDGPLSMTVYSPGTDYEIAVRSIAYLRQCTATDIRRKVTFHLVMDERHFPANLRKLHSAQGKVQTPPASSAASSTAAPPADKRVVKLRSANGQAVARVAAAGKSAATPSTPVTPQPTDSIGLPLINCDQPAPWTKPPAKTYKQLKGLTYPVNVLRNVARQNAATHFVLASDAELYPSPNLIRLFLDMIRRNDSILNLGRPKVFVLPIFEVYGNQTVPDSKSELVGKLKSGLAVPFHQKVCSYCHSVPRSKDWLVANISDDLNVFHIGKRHKPYQRWEPIYIGTQSDPLYDERLTWEGKSDKMTQGYALCVLDYDFMILDNAFLVHRPGVKVPRREPQRDLMAKKQTATIRSTIYRELKILYGHNSNCSIV